MREQVWAAIITYNSEIKRLAKNIDSIIEQVEKIVIVDNASKNFTFIKEKFENEKIYFISNSQNIGIAAALNQAMELAQKNNIRWVITLDDDSVCPPDVINSAMPLFNDKAIGQIVPLLYESNVGEYCTLGTRVNGERYQEVDKSITSASITSVEAWETVGYFDAGLFIDYVDYDFVQKLIIGGYKVIRMNNVKLDHHIGNSVNRKIFFKEIRVANHSSFRKYYIARNIVIYMRRYWKHIGFIKEVLRLMKVFLLIILFEEDKCNKLKKYFKGIFDGLTYQI